MNEGVAFSPSPEPWLASGAGCPSAGIKEHGFESHTDLVPLLSDSVTLDKVFNFPNLSFPPLSN